MTTPTKIAGLAACLLLSCAAARAQPEPTPLNGTPSGPSATASTPYVVPGSSMTLEPAPAPGVLRTHLEIRVDYMVHAAKVLPFVTCTADGSLASVGHPGGWTFAAVGQGTPVMDDPNGIAWQGPIQCASMEGAYVTVKVFPE